MGCRVLKTKDYQITQHYGNRHNGVDLVGQGGTLDTIIAHSAGKVIFCQTGQVHNPNVSESSNLSYGNCVKILHDNGMYTLYAHLANVKVRANQRVEKGQDLGLMGNTGRAFGSHLHFEVYNQNNVRVNPEPYLNKDLDGSVECTGTITYQAYDGKWEEEVCKAATPNQFLKVSCYDEEPQHKINTIFVKIKGFEEYVTLVINNNFSVYKMPVFKINITPDNFELRKL